MAHFLFTPLYGLNLFFKGSVTFGTVVATLMATMGDSAFVLIATSPVHYLLVSLFASVQRACKAFTCSPDGGGNRSDRGSRGERS